MQLGGEFSLDGGCRKFEREAIALRVAEVYNICGGEKQKWGGSMGGSHARAVQSCSLWVDLLTGRARAVLLLPLVNTPQVPSALAISWSPKERRRGKEIVYLAARDWDV